MGAHWAALNDKILVATNPSPNKSPVAYVHPSKYADYKLVPDLATANRCIEMLRAEGFDADGDDKFDWIHDTYLVLIRMFPNGCPPTTIVSMNARYDPHYHVRVGALLCENFGRKATCSSVQAAQYTTCTETSGHQCCSIETTSPSLLHQRLGPWSSVSPWRML